MGSALSSIAALSKGIPVITVATVFQKSPICIYTHKNISTMDQLKHSKRTTILEAKKDMDNWWPCAVQKFGFAKSRMGTYTGSLIPFLEGNKIAQQGYIINEGYDIKKADVKFNTFLLANYGYPQYSEPIESTKSFADKHSNILRKFILASMIGWKSCMSNPELGDKLILKVNKKQALAHLKFAVRMIKKYNLLTDKSLGYRLDEMSNKRWNSIYDVALAGKIVEKGFNVKRAYSLAFMKNIDVKLVIPKDYE